MTANSPSPEQVSSKEDLFEFLADLSRRARAGRTSVENPATVDFIEAAAYWTRAMDGYFTNRGETPPATPEWSTVAMIFAAALVYE